MIVRLATLAVTALAIAACSMRVTFAAANVEWPMSLKPTSEALLPQGTPCRKLANSTAVAEFIDRTTMLVACPGARSTIVVGRFLAVNGGKVLTEVDGFTLISIPVDIQGAGDAKTVGRITKRGQLRCAASAQTAMSKCNYTVLSRSGGSHTVAITRPDGTLRNIHFANRKVLGTDAAKADKPSKQRLTTAREVDQFIVTIGDEHYEIPDDAIPEH